MDESLPGAIDDAVDLKQIDGELHDKISELKSILEKRQSIVEKVRGEIPMRIVSHEVRTPLNAIVGFAELLKEKGDLNDEQSEFVEIIISASMELLDVIDAVLERHERMIIECP